MKKLIPGLTAVFFLSTGCSLFGGGSGSRPTPLDEETASVKAPGETSELVRHIDAGNEYLVAGDLRNATREYERAQEIAPDDPFVNNNLGLVYMEKELCSLAVSYFERAIEVLPYYYKAHNNLGNAYHELGYHDLAEEAYEEALKIKPDYDLAHWNLALLLEKTDDTMGAIRHWQRYISLSAGEGDTAFARNRIALLRDGTSTAPEEKEPISDEEAEYFVE